MGIPFGIVALVLAIVGWTRKDGSEVEAVARAPIMTTEEVFREYNRTSSNETGVPDPFMGGPGLVNEGPAEESVESEKPESYWEDWDNG